MYVLGRLAVVLKAVQQTKVMMKDGMVFELVEEDDEAGCLLCFKYKYFKKLIYCYGILPYLWFAIGLCVVLML